MSHDMYAVINYMRKEKIIDADGRVKTSKSGHKKTREVAASRLLSENNTTRADIKESAKELAKKLNGTIEYIGSY